MKGFHLQGWTDPTLVADAATFLKDRGYQFSNVSQFLTALLEAACEGQAGVVASEDEALAILLTMNLGKGQITNKDRRLLKAVANDEQGPYLDIAAQVAAEIADGGQQQGDRR
jgi:hypothetical protein